MHNHSRGTVSSTKGFSEESWSPEWFHSKKEDPWPTRGKDTRCTISDAFAWVSTMFFLWHVCWCATLSWTIVFVSSTLGRDRTFALLWTSSEQVLNAERSPTHIVPFSLEKSISNPDKTRICCRDHFSLELGDSTMLTELPEGLKDEVLYSVSPAPLFQNGYDMKILLV